MIIGLDLSINSTGVCLRKKNEVLYYLIVPKLTRKMGAINANKTARIRYITYDKIADLDSHNIRCISEKICNIIKELTQSRGSCSETSLQCNESEDIEGVVIEDVAMRANGRSIITLTLLNGYVRCMLDMMHISYKTVSPTSWKKRVLGNGQADKELTIYHWAKFDQEVCKLMSAMNCKMDDVADSYFLACYGELKNIQ